MDIKEAERIIVTKPVATRPTCSPFRSFSEFLAGAVDDSPHETCSTVAAIRPKTVRFNQMVSSAPQGALSSQAKFSGMLLNVNSNRGVSKFEKKATVVHKPRAKLVSKKAVSLLANMGNLNSSHQQMLPLVETHVPCSNQDIQNVPSQPLRNLQNASPTETDQSVEHQNIVAPQSLEDAPNAPPHVTNGDRPSYDGYNWRKYGQKQVKGSEYPRSYYKCTHPNCPVKKKVERSFDGQIAEIVYKGEHNHAKPQPPKRNSSATHGLGRIADTSVHETSAPSWSNLYNEGNEGSEGRVENRYEEGLSASACQEDRALLSSNPFVTGGINTGAGTSDNSCGISTDCDGSKGLDGDDDEPKSKRRKGENQFNEGSVSGEDQMRDPPVAVQSSMDSEILGDGFRWRKYGQKVVKGNPYPRSYYRCTSLSCNVRKHVERASDDPRAFITTYEGKHNHEMPIKIPNSVPSESDSRATTN